MNTKITQSVKAGIVATAVMTLVMYMGPMMGMPKMNAAQMLSMMMGVPVIAGWLMHFMIGIIFALSYTFFFINLVKKISSKVLKGAIFGMAVFIFAQIVMAIMGIIMGGMPPIEGSMALMMIGSVMGHVTYGIVVAVIIKESV